MTDKLVESFWSKVQRGSPNACWLWAGARKDNGHGMVYGAVGRHGRAHRVAWEIANGKPVPKGLVVRHTCDVPLCVNPNHLLTGTTKQNMHDCISRGRAVYPSGERNGQAKITLADAIAIRAARGTNREVAQRYGISIGQAGKIRTGFKWRHASAGE